MAKRIERRDSPILVRLTPAEKAAVGKAAASADRSVSQWARLALLAAAARAGVPGAQE